MKSTIQLLKFIAIAMLFGVFMVACRKMDKTPTDPLEPPPVNESDSANADTVSNHLQFFNATKKQGTIPGGPAGNSLKISFEDTLYLTDELKKPIKFLHEDPKENVAGIYVQVRGTFTGSSATYYYDVPELQETANNDTVSVILIGVDPEGLINTEGVPPAGAPFVFEVTICPYGPTGEILGTAVRPVKISEPKVEPNGNGGACGLVTQPGDYWRWQMSYIRDLKAEGKFLFFNSPDKIWGQLGQNIKGSCCDGISVYGICLGDTVANSSLHFNTFFNYAEEIFKFIEDGTFERLTGLLSSNPDPNGSDFCGSGEGVAEEQLLNVTYRGKWTIKPTGPINGDSLYLNLQGTSSTPPGTGYGNPGGIIHYMDCDLLVLIQPDNEVPDRDLIKFYDYRNINSPIWFPFS